jgi:DNA-directed RNA polymerase specialized sigma24 family protein
MKEIAERMGRSVDAVKHLLARALDALRERFGDTESYHLVDRRLDTGGRNDGE